MIGAGGRAWQIMLGLAASTAPLSPVAAEVVQAAQQGFVVHEHTVVQAGHDQVWAALVQPALWWNKEHTWSGDAANLVLDARGGGCFCEALPGAGSAEHMAVVQAVPGSLLRMKGALGPLQSEALAGVLTIEVKAADGRTSIDWTYVVGGYARFPLQDIAPAVDTVLAEQANRLAALVESGNPDHLSRP